MAIDPDTRGMLHIPAGPFMMGSDAYQDERPVRTVHLSEYFIDPIPVANMVYRQFIAHDGYARRELWTATGWEWRSRAGITEPLHWKDVQSGSAEDQPVMGLSWWEAMAYARFAGKALPTEAQWERAARASCAGASPGETIYRIAEVSEWCVDNWSPCYAWDVTRSDPLFWRSEAAEHVSRGAAVPEGGGILTHRARHAPEGRQHAIGLRCVVNVDHAVTEGARL